MLAMSGSSSKTAETWWNAAYDAGMGAGAIGIGLFVAHTGYPAAFLLTAAMVIPALIPARREQAR